MGYLLDIESLKEILNNMRAPESYYNIGSYKEGALCIVSENGNWIVFEGERGQRYNLKTFDNECDACLYFMEKMNSFLR